MSPWATAIHEYVGAACRRLKPKNKQKDALGGMIVRSAQFRSCRQVRHRSWPHRGLDLAGAPQSGAFPGAQGLETSSNMRVDGRVHSTSVAFTQSSKSTKVKQADQ